MRHSPSAPRAQAEAAVLTVIERLERLAILVNNAGLMLLGPVVGANLEDYERMIAINQTGLLYMTHAALPHLLTAAEEGPRRLAPALTSAIFAITGKRLRQLPVGRQLQST